MSAIVNGTLDCNGPVNVSDDAPLTNLSYTVMGRIASTPDTISGHTAMYVTAAGTLVFRYEDGATTHYNYLDQTNVTPGWQYSTTPP